MIFTYKVDMHCQNCAKKVTKALEETGIKFEVSLENKTVVVDGCEKCAAKAEKAIENAGFKAERV